MLESLFRHAKNICKSDTASWILCRVLIVDRYKKVDYNDLVLTRTRYKQDIIYISIFSTTVIFVKWYAQSCCISLNRMTSYDFKRANCPGKVSVLHVKMLKRYKILSLVRVNSYLVLFLSFLCSLCILSLCYFYCESWLARFSCYCSKLGIVGTKPTVGTGKQFWSPECQWSADCVRYRKTVGHTRYADLQHCFGALNLSDYLPRIFT